MKFIQLGNLMVNLNAIKSFEFQYKTNSITITYTDNSVEPFTNLSYKEFMRIRRAIWRNSVESDLEELDYNL